MKTQPLELVRVPISIGLGSLKISSIHTQKAILVDIVLKTILKQNLYTRLTKGEKKVKWKQKLYTTCIYKLAMA